MRSSILLVVTLLSACHEPRHDAADAMVAPTPAIADASVPVDSGLPADSRRPEETAEVEKLIVRENHWVWLHIGEIPPAETIFAIDDDGRAFLVDGRANVYRVIWSGNIDPASVKQVEDSIHKVRFCSIKSESGLDSFMTIAFHGWTCSVTLSYKTWEKNPHARVVHRAVRELMKANCGDANQNGLAGPRN